VIVRKTTSSNSARQQAMPGSDIGGAEGSAVQPSDATEQQQQQQQTTQGGSEDAASREARIRRAAYDAYVRRGGAPGDEVQDWLDAEKQVDSQKK
jgi:hypothetical protein